MSDSFDYDSLPWQPIASAPFGELVIARETNSPYRVHRATKLDNGYFSSKEGGIMLPFYPQQWLPDRDDIPTPFQGK